jgi:hypothetical protein
LGARILDKLEKDLADVGEVEMRPRMEGNQMFIILGPKRHKGGGGGESGKHEKHEKPAATEKPAAAAEKPAAPADKVNPAVTS